MKNFSYHKISFCKEIFLRLIRENEKNQLKNLKKFIYFVLLFLFEAQDIVFFYKNFLNFCCLRRQGSI